MAYEKYGYNVQDADLGDAAVAMPNNASTTVYSDDIDLGAESFKGGDFEIEINLPAFTTTMLPNTRTLTVDICAGAAASPTTVVAAAILVSTGSGTDGAAAQSIRYRVKAGVARYLRVKFTTGASATDCSSVNASVKVYFA